MENPNNPLLDDVMDIMIECGKTVKEKTLDVVCTGILWDDTTKSMDDILRTELLKDSEYFWKLSFVKMESGDSIVLEAYNAETKEVQNYIQRILVFLFDIH